MTSHSSFNITVLMESQFFQDSEVIMTIWNVYIANPETIWIDNSIICTTHTISHSVECTCRNHVILNLKCWFEAENRCRQVWETRNLISTALANEHMYMYLLGPFPHLVKVQKHLTTQPVQPVQSYYHLCEKINQLTVTTFYLRPHQINLMLH